MLRKLQLVFVLVPYTLRDCLELVISQPVEVLHLLEEFARDASLEECVNQLPKVEVILDFPCRDHSVVVGFEDVVILVVKQVLHCAAVFALGRGRGWVVNRVSELVSFVRDREDWLVRRVNQTNEFSHVTLEPKLYHPLRIVAIVRRHLLSQVQRNRVHVDVDYRVF
jgi:hypothetical protein